MGQVDTPRQVTWSVFVCCCCWNIAKSARLLLVQQNAEASLGFQEIDRLSGGLCHIPFFALCYVCQHVDRFWSVFLGKLLLPYMLHADMLFSDWFPQETGGRGSHHMLVALGERLPVCGSWPTGNPDNHVTIPPFKSWYVLIIPVPLSSFCMIYPRKSNKNIPWGPAPCAMRPFPRNPRVLWLCPRLGVTTSFGDGHACTTRPAETRIAALWLEAVAVFRSTTSWWWWNQIVHIIYIYVCV